MLDLLRRLWSRLFPCKAHDWIITDIVMTDAKAWTVVTCKRCGETMQTI